MSSIRLFPLSSQAKISFSAPWYRTLWAYFLTSICETKSHTRTKQQSFTSVYFNLYIFGKQIGRNNIMAGMVAGILWLQSVLTFFVICCYSLLPTIWNLPHIMEQLHSLLILIINLFGNQSAEEGGSARKLTNKWNLFFTLRHIRVLLWVIK